MLKSYEAIYDNGRLHWTGPKPPSAIEKSRVLVVVDVDSDSQKDVADLHALLDRSRGCVKPLRSIEQIDNELASMRSEWDREWEK